MPANAKESGDGMDYTYEERMLAVCGDYKQVGHSSIFGSPEQYKGRYEINGPLSAEMDRVKKIQYNTRQKANSILKVVKNRIDYLDYTQYKNNQMRSRNEGTLSSTPGVQSSTMGVFAAEQGQLAKEEAYIKSKAYNDTIAALKSDGGRVSKDEYVESSYSFLLECRDFWTWQSRKNPWDR
jgi:hypothetical protein